MRHLSGTCSALGRRYVVVSLQYRQPQFSNGGFHRPIRVPRDQLQKQAVPPPSASLVRRVFQYSKQGLAKLKAKANSEAGHTNKISTLQALTAHLWWSYTRSRRCLPDHPKNNLSLLSIPIGARARIPLPDGYFGNAAQGAAAVLDEEELLQERIGDAAVKINELIREQTRERLAKVVEDWMKNPFYHEVRSHLFIIAGSPRNDVYGVDFGWGKPIGIKTAANFDRNMITFPTTATGGIEVHACLLPAVLGAIEQDAEFMEAFTI